MNTLVLVLAPRRHGIFTDAETNTAVNHLSWRLGDCFFLSFVLFGLLICYASFRHVGPAIVRDYAFHSFAVHIHQFHLANRTLHFRMNTHNVLKETDRRTDRQTGGQAGRQADRQADRQTRTKQGYVLCYLRAPDDRRIPPPFSKQRACMPSLCSPITFVSSILSWRR